MDDNAEVTPEVMTLHALARSEMGLFGEAVDAEWMVSNGPLGRQARSFGAAAGRETTRLQRQGKSNRTVMGETLQYQGAQYATFVVEQSYLSAQLLARLVDLTGRASEEILYECRAEREGN